MNQVGRGGLGGGGEERWVDELQEASQTTRNLRFENHRRGHWTRPETGWGGGGYQPGPLGHMGGMSSTFRVPSLSPKGEGGSPPLHRGERGGAHGPEREREGSHGLVGCVPFAQTPARYPLPCQVLLSGHAGKVIWSLCPPQNSTWLQ